jgi:hypothetical protein
MALDAGVKKIAKLEGVLDDERQALANLRVELAAANERASYTDELRQLIEGLQKSKPAASED